MSAVADLLPVIRERIERYRGEGLNEMNTKAVLIAPMLNALGWDDEDLEQVHREYRYQSSDNPVDYALMDRRMPRLFVEAKALGKNLNDPKWARQIMGYASVAGVEWVVLTDGNEYRIYNSHATVPVEEKLLRTIRLTDEDASVTEILDLLTREGLQENRLGVHWQAQFVDRQVQEVLKGLFLPEPDNLFVNWLTRRLADLTRGDVSASLRRVRARFDFPGASVDGTEGSAATDDSDSGNGSTEQQSPTQPSHLVRLRHLIEKDCIRPPLDLHTTYKRQRITARVTADGGVEFRGEGHPSLSSAAAAARRFVSGTPEARFPTNGWTFWRFTDADGQERPIDLLRQRYLAQGESDGS